MPGRESMISIISRTICLGVLKLSALLTRTLGEHLDEVEVGVAQHVGWRIGIAQAMLLKMGEQLFQQGIGDATTASPQARLTAPTACQPRIGGNG